jgi:hypothetical protein
MAQWHAKDGTYKRYDGHGRLIQRRPVAETPILGTTVVIGEKMRADHDRLVSVSPRYLPKAAPLRAAVIVESDEDAATTASTSTKGDLAREEALKKFPWLAGPDDFVAAEAVSQAPMEISPHKVIWGNWTIRLRNKDYEALQKGEISIVIPHDLWYPYLVNPNGSSEKTADREKMIFSKARHVYPNSFQVPPRSRHKTVHLYLPGQAPKEVG